MNKDRRNIINTLSSRLDDLKTEIESIMEDEQAYFDNMPQSFQDGEKGGRAQAAIDALQEAIDGFDAITSALETATE